MNNIAIFASGKGSNAEKIVEYFKGHATISVKLIVSSSSNAGVIDVAKTHGVPHIILDRETMTAQAPVIDKLNAREINWIILAGYLNLIPKYLTDLYPNRILNIHPALLPKYGGKGMYGKHVHEAVVKAKEKESGITVHYVNELYDDGAIIFQASCSLSPGDNPNDVQQKVQKLEHQYFPKAIESVISGTL